ncbi:tRNA uridine-5-carboxymethylaminomethyl(34) synthesis GTPase MnmE [Serpentinicella sp. ANB-PHB4]|uniref:tRNA uridine-5-carboxymethylaminomethyl(34) synthesis GTPase MnmE n=1 Tax=Serpentinicella sp. ANB-PHB4 TaxID=3074076 RepID=UPI002863C87A|nr:tRNA uridine-5-carboxymethylaminomethyl(34) synthesis GTPase MnmE [Serpentinicella sp. ANB-PHB4]MDR5658906.1 tRNA uridine-5-carboxymethylaminomethyl(34) synthesis GTPase MnmE [Serpentinicella sp. ANB-PHB4]
MFLSDTIAAIATAPGEAGIGIVRISGESAIDIADKIFKSKKGKKLSEFDERRITYGNVFDPNTGNRLDEVLVSYMKAPYTYTTEDIVEINCHGGYIPVKNILELVLRMGARSAEPGEFTKRAFLNGRIDLSQAEAVMDLISAKTDKGFDVALDQLEGTLSKKVKEIITNLMDMLAHIEVSIDFAEEDVDEVTLDILLNKSKEVKKEIQQLLDTADTGKIIREGLNTVIVGKPNVGKSSLMNTLLGESRAIVTDVPGTTRDIIEENLSIRGIPLKIIDTAGIRETDDIVEKIGVEKSKQFFNKADLIIFMLDISSSLTEDDIQILELIRNRKALVILNKLDLPHKIDEGAIVEYIDSKNIIKLSVLSETGIEDLEERIVDMVYKGDVKSKDTVMVTNARHRNALERALKSLEEGVEAIEQKLPLDFIEVDVRDCWEALGEISGDTVEEDLINHIFQNFCIGK